MNGEIFTVKAEIEVDFTEEDLGDIICTAFEGGIGYWGCLDNTKPEWKEKPKEMPASEYITKLLLDGGSITVFDTELEEDELTDEDIWTLNLDNLLEGIRLWIERGGSGMVDGGRIDTCSIDADEADCIVQYALFGKLVFG